MIEFALEGSQRYERVIRVGALKEAVIPQMLMDIQTADDYLAKLVNMEVSNAMLFYHRKKLMVKGI